MGDFLHDVEIVPYTIQEEGNINLNDLLSFIESLDYDSDTTLNLKINNLDICMVVQNPEEGKIFFLSITQDGEETEIELPKTLTTFKEVGEYLLTYLKINF